MAGRPTKYNEERARTIIERLKMGATKKAAYESIGVDQNTFYAWYHRFQEFRESVIRAEQECEVMNAGVLKKAAAGFDTQETTRTTKTVFKTREIHQPDGTIIKEPVAMQEVTETVTTGREFDWRAAESWLKRRRRDEWGDSLDIRRLSTEQILEALDRDLARGTDPEERILARLGPGAPAAESD